MENIRENGRKGERTTEEREEVRNRRGGDSKEIGTVKDEKERREKEKAKVLQRRSWGFLF